MERGWFSLGRLRGVPIRVHWTAPLGAIFFGRLAWVPGFWLGFVLLIVVHELGHAAMVRLSRQMVLGVDVHGFGGACRWVGSATPMQRALIAWGGVFGQLALLAITLLVVLLVPLPKSPFVFDLTSALIYTNLLLAAVNLLPFAPLDGAEAWRIVPLLRERYRQRSAGAKPRRTPERDQAREPNKRQDSFPPADGHAEIRRILEQTADIARREVEKAKRDKHRPS